MEWDGFTDRFSQPLIHPKTDTVVARVVLDLTVYLHDPTEDTVTRLIDIYQHHCPEHRLAEYTIAEWPNWVRIDKPVVTDTVGHAIRDRTPRPALAPVFRRIRESRGFELGFWDGNEIEDPNGSWSFNCMKVLRRNRDPFSFVRVIMPFDTEPNQLFKLAYDMAAEVPFLSGHAGYAFAYHPFRKIDAFEVIYALARRFWGIDVEDLNASVRSEDNVLKSLSWLTLLGSDPFRLAIDAVGAMTTDQITLHRVSGGGIIRVGSAPDVLDINRPTTDLYERLGAALKPALPTNYPAFDGVDFGTEDHTIGWLRRFAEPEGWRT